MSDAKTLSPVDQIWLKMIELQRANGRKALDLIECFVGEDRQAQVRAMMLAVAEATGGPDGQDLAVLKALVRPYVASRVVDTYSGNAAGLLQLTNAAQQWVYCEDLQDDSVNEADVAKVLTAEVQAGLPMAINLAWLCGGQDADTWFQTNAGGNVRVALDVCAAEVLKWDPDLGLELCECAPMDRVIALFCRGYHELAAGLLQYLRVNGTTDPASFDRDFVGAMSPEALVDCVPDDCSDSLWTFIKRALRLMSEGHQPAARDEEAAEAEPADDLGDGAEAEAAPPA